MSIENKKRLALEQPPMSPLQEEFQALREMVLANLKKGIGWKEAGAHFEIINECEEKMENPVEALKIIKEMSNGRTEKQKNGMRKL